MLNLHLRIKTSNYSPRQRKPFTRGPGTFAKQKLIPVLLDRYFSTGIESRTTNDDRHSKCSAILPRKRKEKEVFKSPQAFSGCKCEHMHSNDDSTQFSKMAAIGGTVAQEHCGGFSFENCKR